jgi:hypothetical protein
MLTRRSALVFLGFGALGLGLTKAAQASVARALSLVDLSRQSERVLVGTALQASSRWESVGGRKRIVTYTRVRVDELVAGEAGDSEILVRTLGGKVGKIGQVVHGEALLLLNEAALLFIGYAPDGVIGVAGMSQGHYPIRPDDKGTRRLRPSPRSFEILGDDSAARRLSGRTIADARDLVRKAWNAR